MNNINKMGELKSMESISPKLEALK